MTENEVSHPIALSQVLDDLSDVDPAKVILLDGFRRAVVSPDGEHTALGLELAGRLNNSEDRARIMFLIHPTELAALVAAMVDLAARTDMAEEFNALMEKHLKDYRTGGL